MKGRRVTRRKKKGPARGSRRRVGGLFNFLKGKPAVPASAPAPINNSQPKQLVAPAPNNKKVGVFNSVSHTLKHK